MFAPTTFGKYFLTRRLAVGGMAEVFAAKLYGADGFEKDLVIKQILPQYARVPEFVQAFVAEAKIAVSLSHANIVGIYELGRVDGTYFIAMEYVDGLDVFSLVKAAARQGVEIDVGMSLLVAEDVSKGLDYAHRKTGHDGLPLGLVHRDMNPRNVLVSRGGQVKILDFGIAKITSAAEALTPKTRTGVVKGTSGYMSPEQAAGREIDSRTDVYQAGLLLFEMLTGRPLFWRPDERETRDLMRRHEVSAPSTFSAAVPPEVDRLVLDALEPDRERRIQTAADLATRIAQIRFLFYPNADHPGLGEIVDRVMRGEAREAEALEAELPRTAEIRRTFEAEAARSAGAVETIARAPPKEEAPAPMAGGRATQARARRAVALASISLLGGLVFAGLYAASSGAGESPPTVEALPAPADGPSEGEHANAVARRDPPPRDVEPRSTVEAEAAPSDRRGRTTARREDGAQPEHSRSGPTRDPGFATVSFGTRSCSSRVSIDGQVIARTTPSFDHRISAGRRKLVFEGTACPAVERPGSLDRSVPTLVDELEITHGTRLKVIADFERNRVMVRRE